jgi:hypothetical protein
MHSPRPIADECRALRRILVSALVGANIRFMGTYVGGGVKGGRLCRTRKPGRALKLLCKRMVAMGWKRTPSDVADANTQ